VAAGVALQAFSLGIPCVYYGTEQALAGPEASERPWLPDWGGSDRYLREAMFGPMHPRRSGRAGLPGAGDGYDDRCPASARSARPAGIASTNTAPPIGASPRCWRCAGRYPRLRHGRQYARPIAFLGYPFAVYGPGELIAWSRILDDEELVCIVNGHGTAARGADVLVDATLNPPDGVLWVALNTAQAGNPDGYHGPHPVGSSLPVRRTAQGIAYIEIRDLPASEVLVLANRAKAEGGAVLS
jgi:hypothetical protein